MHVRCKYEREDKRRKLGVCLQDEALRGPSIPHDIAVSPSGREIYIADLLQHTVRKFIKDLPDTPTSDGKAE